MSLLQLYIFWVDNLEPFSIHSLNGGSGSEVFSSTGPHEGFPTIYKIHPDIPCSKVNLQSCWVNRWGCNKPQHGRNMLLCLENHEHLCWDRFTGLQIVQTACHIFWKSSLLEKSKVRIDSPVNLEFPSRGGTPQTIQVIGAWLSIESPMTFLGSPILRNPPYIKSKTSRIIHQSKI